MIFITACSPGDFDEGVQKVENAVETAQAMWTLHDLPDGIPLYMRGVDYSEFEGTPAQMVERVGPDDNGWSRELWLNPNGSLTWKWLNQGNLIHRFDPNDGICYEVETDFVVVEVTTANSVNGEDRFNYSVKECPLGIMPE